MKSISPPSKRADLLVFTQSSSKRSAKDAAATCSILREGNRVARSRILPELARPH